jgi:hypothetical protein
VTAHRLSCLCALGRARMASADLRFAYFQPIRLFHPVTRFLVKSVSIFQLDTQSIF